MKDFTIDDVKEASKLLPKFVQMCENDLGEDQHKVAKPLTHAEYEKIQTLLSKLNVCNNHVDVSIFE